MSLGVPENPIDHLHFVKLHVGLGLGYLEDGASS